MKESPPPSYPWHILADAIQSKDDRLSETGFEQGKAAANFIALAKKKTKQDLFTVPRNAEEFTATQALLLELNTDLTHDSHWERFWQQAHDFVTQSQVLAAYRTQVINATTFHHTLLVNPQEQQLWNIRTLDYLQFLNQAITQFGDDLSYEQFLLEARVQLVALSDKARIEIKNLSANKQLANVMLWLSFLLRDLQASLPYQILGAQRGQEILSFLVERISQLQFKQTQLQDALIQLCQQLKPGQDIVSAAQRQVQQLSEQAFFSTTCEIPNEVFIKALNHPSQLRMVHKEMIGAWCARCLPHLKDFPSLQHEIHAIHDFRLRRHLITAIFFEILDKYEGFSRSEHRISREDEECLLSLQREYLEAIYGQLEKLPRNEAGSFLEELKTDPVLQPLPKSSVMGEKSAEIAREFAILIQNYSSPKRHYLAGGAHEHAKGYPLEIEVLRQFIWHLLNAAKLPTPNLNKPDSRIRQPNFSVDMNWHDYFVLQSFAEAKICLQNEHFGPKQVQLLMEFYETVENRARAPKHWLQISPKQADKTWRGLLQWAQEAMLLALENWIKQISLQKRYDAYSFYRNYLVMVLHSNLGKGIVRNKQQALQLQQVLQLLIDKIPQNLL